MRSSLSFPRGGPSSPRPSSPIALPPTGRRGRTARTRQPRPLSRGGGWGGRERDRGEGLGRGKLPDHVKLAPMPPVGERAMGERGRGSEGSAPKGALVWLARSGLRPLPWLS
jgi:hypothetical protein